MGLLLIMLAAFWAVGEGGRNATSSVRENYRDGRDRRRKSAAKRRKLAARGGGPAPRSASTGVKIASGASTVAVSGFLISRGFVDGVRAGWPKGKERAQRWADTRKKAKDTSVSADSTTTGDTPKSPSDGDTSPLHLVKDSDSAPKTPAADGDGPTKSTTASTTGGSNPMSINTVTGGEVHSFDQLLAELNAIAVEAQAEVEDAQADAERARQDAERIDTMVACLAELKLDSETLGKISALTDAASSRLEAANSRAVAAETRASGALDTAQHVQKGHSALAEAYASAPEGGASREFYTAS